MSTATLTKFFGMTSASPEFLREHGIYYTRRGRNLDVFAEKSSTGRVLVYLLDHVAGQLRVLTPEGLQQLYPAVTGDRGGLDQLPLDELEHAGQPVGQLVYRQHYQDDDNRGSFPHAAYDAALARGVTHATARWFARLVEYAFTGMEQDQQFTPAGVRYVTSSFHVGSDTVSRQLSQLQKAGALTFTREKGGEAFVVRLNQVCLPGMAHELTPHFFRALCYEPSQEGSEATGA